MHRRQAALITELDALTAATQDPAAAWESPLEFEAAGNKAPYLPETVSTRQASMGEDSDSDEIFSALMERLAGTPMAELGVLVALLRAAAVVHQTHHWQTRGGEFYGDHLLFERLYDESVPFIDQVAERAMGQGHPFLVDAKTQSSLVNGLVHVWCKTPGTANPLDLVGCSLEIEKCVTHCVGAALESLEMKDSLSNGTDNLLQGIADKHEEFMYLLQQRLPLKMGPFRGGET